MQRVRIEHNEAMMETGPDGVAVFEVCEGPPRRIRLWSISFGPGRGWWEKAMARR